MSPQPHGLLMLEVVAASQLTPHQALMSPHGLLMLEVVAASQLTPHQALMSPHGLLMLEVVATSQLTPADVYPKPSLPTLNQQTLEHLHSYWSSNTQFSFLCFLIPRTPLN